MPHAVNSAGLGSCPVVSLTGADRLFLCVDPLWGICWGQILIHGDNAFQ